MTYYTSGKAVYHSNENGEAPTHICDAANNEASHLIATRLNEYPSSEYMADCDVTNSTIFKPEQIELSDIVAVLTSIAGFAEDLNISKKLLFRGKTRADLGMNGIDGATLADKLPNIGPHEVNVLHGLVGAITEAGEMAEVLLRWIETGTLDAVNVNEECGDAMWYIVRALRGVDRSVEHCMRTNIDKLHGRHGESFDPFRDANRDLDAERAKLEAAHNGSDGEFNYHNEDVEDDDRETSDEVASLAGKTLGDDNATDRERSLAGSALSQAAGRDRGRVDVPAREGRNVPGLDRIGDDSGLA